MGIKFNSLLYKTNRFHVAVGLFSNRSQKTSKCCKNISDQGCALTAPGRLRRLTFGFGRVKKTTRSPGRALWLIVFLADKAAKNFNMLVVIVYETSQKIFFLRTKQSV